MAAFKLFHRYTFHSSSHESRLSGLGGTAIAGHIACDAAGSANDGWFGKAARTDRADPC
jgi:hypothetical protein